MSRAADQYAMSRRGLLKAAGLSGLALGGLGLAGCRNGNSSGGNSDDLILIGACMPMTGAAAGWGKESFYAMTSVASAVNKAGGIKSMKGRKIKVIVADNEGVPRKVATETERLIAREKVVAMTGFTTSSASTVGREIVERQKMPTLDCAYANNLTDDNPEWYFRSSIRTSILAESGVAFAREMSSSKDVPLERVILLHEDGPFGTEAIDFAAKEIENTDWEVVDRLSYSAAELTDAAALVRRIKSARPDVVFVATSVSDGILVQKAINSLNVSVKGGFIHLAGAPYNQDFINAMGTGADGVFDSIGFTPPMAEKLTEESQVAIKDYTKRWKIPLNNHAAQNMTMMAAMVDSLERAGSTDPDAIREAIAATDLDWTEMPHVVAPNGVKFNDRHDNERADTFVAQMKDSVLEPVWPQEYAIRQPNWPLA